MKQILFKTDMVQSILRQHDPKTMTRRLSGLEAVNANPNDWILHRYWDGHAKFTEKHNATNEVYCKSKYQPGDILYVRETCRELVDCRTGKFHSYDYKADMPDEFHAQYPHIWIPSLFMPKSAARIFLKVTDTKAERLQDISEADAISEGIEAKTNAFYRNYLSKTGATFYDPVDSFRSLWQSINAKTSPWEKNDWVWVYSFTRIEKP